MEILNIDGREYRLPSPQNTFQREMFIHLIDWKWVHVTRDPGFHRGKPFDAILPDTYKDKFPVIYPAIRDALKNHQEKFPFRFHLFFNHMASSQAANFNLFLPILLHSNANAVLRTLKSDFDRLALSELDHGYRIEFWDDPYGNLSDHTHMSGTDADIAIAYYNHQGELCLWLIEHKLTEKEFTTCGGSKSKGRRAIHNCRKSFSEILIDKQVCYYHSANHYKFWNITEENQTFFAHHAQHAYCPFQGGLNQLWRNQLMGLSIEQDDRQPFEHVTFSVVKHPRNTYLDQSLAEYQLLVANNPKFSVFTSKNVLDAVAGVNDPELDQWITWYRELYAL
jgi:hypothetical protein